VTIIASTNLLLAFVGDDFTGSTDAMEALTRAGIPAVLFLRPPAPGDLARFPDARAVGVASAARALPTGQMEAALRPTFESLRALGTPLVHYKVCSTFDSSPEIGSIGRAIEIGQDVFAAACVPLVVGAPPLGRFCVFGNLFARVRADDPRAVFRLDRHPTMSRHPVTPMNEADLRVHLRKQTGQPMGLMNFLDLAGSDDEVNARLQQQVSDGVRILLFDTLTNAHLATIGRLLWQTATEAAAPVFCAGSSAVEYALAARWQATGAAGTPPTFNAEPVPQVIAVSGSCSPVTERQIAWAEENGFVLVALDPANVDEAGAANAAVRVLSSDARRPGVVVYTSRGGVDANALPGAQLGNALGRILREILARTGVRRAAVCGGDTSGCVAQTLGIDALTTRAPLAPGSPLCRAHAKDGLADGLEIVFKGGQVGTDDFFGRVRRGSGPEC